MKILRVWESYLDNEQIVKTLSQRDKSYAHTGVPGAPAGPDGPGGPGRPCRGQKLQKMSLWKITGKIDVVCLRACNVKGEAFGKHLYLQKLTVSTSYIETCVTMATSPWKQQWHILSTSHITCKRTPSPLAPFTPFLPFLPS